MVVLTREKQNGLGVRGITIVEDDPKLRATIVFYFKLKTVLTNTKYQAV